MWIILPPVVLLLVNLPAPVTLDNRLVGVSNANGGSDQFGGHFVSEEHGRHVSHVSHNLPGSSSVTIIRSHPRPSTSHSSVSNFSPSHQHFISSPPQQNHQLQQFTQLQKHQQQPQTYQSQQYQQPFQSGHQHFVQRQPLNNAQQQLGQYQFQQQQQPIQQHQTYYPPQSTNPSFTSVLLNGNRNTVPKTISQFQSTAASSHIKADTVNEPKLLTHGVTYQQQQQSNIPESTTAVYDAGITQPPPTTTLPSYRYLIKDQSKQSISTQNATTSTRTIEHLSHERQPKVFSSSPVSHSKAPAHMDDVYYYPIQNAQNDDIRSGAILNSVGLQSRPAATMPHFEIIPDENEIPGPFSPRFHVDKLEVSEEEAREEIQAEFRQSGLYPDFLPELPNGLVNINFGFHGCVHMGSSLIPAQTVNPPSRLTFPANATTYYTLALADVESEILHWLVVNIPGGRVSQGNVIAEFQPPSSRLSSGMHRYAVVALAQPDAILYGLEPFSAGYCDFTGRENFKMKDLMTTFNLDIVAGNFFKMENDPKVSEQLCNYTYV